MEIGGRLSLDCVIISPPLKSSITSRQPESGFCFNKLSHSAQDIRSLEPSIPAVSFQPSLAANPAGGLSNASNTM
jgi:hypothetical protein